MEEPPPDQQLLTKNWARELANKRLSAQLRKFVNEIIESGDLHEIAKCQFLPLQTNKDGKPYQVAMALVKSKGKCGLGPIISTNPTIGMVNFLWDIVNKNHLVEFELWENDRKRSRIQSN